MISMGIFQVRLLGWSVNQIVFMITPLAKAGTIPAFCIGLEEHPGGRHPAGGDYAGRQSMSRSDKWPQVRQLAWNRDRKARTVCHICGQPIDYSLKPSSDPEAWEPDHVLPVSKYPELELDLKNIKASHMRCNRARGDDSYHNLDIGMQSRVW